MADEQLWRAIGELRNQQQTTALGQVRIEGKLDLIAERMEQSAEQRNRMESAIEKIEGHLDTQNGRLRKSEEAIQDLKKTRPLERGPFTRNQKVAAGALLTPVAMGAFDLLRHGIELLLAVVKSGAAKP